MALAGLSVSLQALHALPAAQWQHYPGMAYARENSHFKVEQVRLRLPLLLALAWSSSLVSYLQALEQPHSLGRSN